MSEQSPLPNLIIAGVVKAGTTSAFMYLSRHPEVCPSAVKEAQYFSGYRYGKPIAPLEDYRALFSRYSGERYVLEATPGYFEGGRPVAEAIRDTLGENVRILLIFRDPVDRALSMFKYKKSILELDKQMSLEDYIALCEETPLEVRQIQENSVYGAIDGGLYSVFLKDWIDVFGDRLRVMFFDKLQNDRASFMIDLCGWLGLDPAIYDQMQLDIENQSRAYKSKRLQGVALKINERLEVFLRKFPKLKSTLRSMYFKINTDNFNSSHSQDALDHLHQIFAPYNQELLKTLEGAGYTEFPDWLGK